MERLGELFPTENIYKPNVHSENVLHFTLRVLVLFGVDLVLEDDVLKDMESILKKVPPFYIDYKGVSATQSCIIIKGYLSIDLQPVREELKLLFERRNITERADLLLKKKWIPNTRYENEFCYSTIVRFSDETIPHSETIDKMRIVVGEFKETFIATVFVRKLVLGFET